MRIRIQHLKIAGLLALVLALGVTGAVMAQPGGQTVSILSPVFRYDEPIYYDANNDGQTDEGELVGIYNVYDGNEELQISWPVADFGEQDGAYRVSLRQHHPDGSMVELKISHHWASGEAVELYTYGSFGFGEAICQHCPTEVVVMPEIVTPVYNEAAETWQYTYTLIDGMPELVSTRFVFEVFRPVWCPPEQMDDPCVHPTFYSAPAKYYAFYQHYYERNPDNCLCECTLTSAACDESGYGGRIDYAACECVP